MARQRGYAYLFMLFLVAMLAVSLLAVADLEYYGRQREREAELLRIGGEFRTALAAYRQAGPAHAYPSQLEELLSDHRAGREQRYLRRIYLDPMTRTKEWGLVRENGRIVGVHSLSAQAPLKIAGFEPEDATFAGATHYSDWVFRADAAPPPARPAD